MIMEKKRNQACEPQVARGFIQETQSGPRIGVFTSHYKTSVELINYLRNALIEASTVSVSENRQSVLIRDVN